MCQANIKVTIIVWLVEFLGCMTLALEFFVIGSRSNAITGLLRTLTMLIYFVVMPCTFLINCSEGKNTIVDNNWREALAGIFKSTKEGDQRRSQISSSDDKIEAPKRSSHKNSSAKFITSNAKVANDDGVVNDSNKQNKGAQNKTVASPPMKRQRKEAWTQRRSQRRSSDDKIEVPKRSSHKTSSGIFIISKAKVANDDAVVKYSNKQNRTVASSPKKRRKKDAWT